jgi:pantoate--beta-alanine ligase
LVFVPSSAEMYAADARTVVEVRDLGDGLCGRTRPGHFRGVATVVAKLLHLMQPHVAVFGQKDAQQALILRRMVHDLDWPIELRFGPIVRDPDGLALSSRNAYLSPSERREALLLWDGLVQARAVIEAGERRGSAIVERAKRVLARGAHVRAEYVELVDIDSLRPLHRVAGSVLLAVAAFVGATRLIDNLMLDVHDGRVADLDLRG